MLRIVQRQNLPILSGNLHNLLSRSCRWKTTHCIDSWTCSTSSIGFAEVYTHFDTFIKAMDPLESMQSVVEKTVEESEDPMSMARVSLHVSLPDDFQVDSELRRNFAEDIQFNPFVKVIKSEPTIKVRLLPQERFDFPPEDISLTIEVPLQTNLNVRAINNANLHINSLEGGWTYDVVTDKGNCYLSKLKGTDLHVKSNQGNIISDSTLLAEFGTLDVGNEGEIKVGKLQGRKFCLESESGNIQTGPLYLERGEVTSNTGSITLGDVHGITQIKAKGSDISVGSVSGELTAITKKGNIQAHLSKSTNVHLKTKKGNITATFEKSQESIDLLGKAKKILFGSDVEVKKSEEDVGDNFTILKATVNPSNKVEASSFNLKLKAEAKEGSLQMEFRDWFSSLKFNTFG